MFLLIKPSLRTLKKYKLCNRPTVLLAFSYSSQKRPDDGLISRKTFPVLSCVIRCVWFWENKSEMSLTLTFIFHPVGRGIPLWPPPLKYSIDVLYQLLEFPCLLHTYNGLSRYENTSKMKWRENLCISYGSFLKVFLPSSLFVSNLPSFLPSLSWRLDSYSHNLN